MLYLLWFTIDKESLLPVYVVTRGNVPVRYDWPKKTIIADQIKELVQQDIIGYLQEDLVQERIAAFNAPVLPPFPDAPEGYDTWSNQKIPGADWVYCRHCHGAIPPENAEAHMCTEMKNRLEWAKQDQQEAVSA